MLRRLGFLAVLATLGAVEIPAPLSVSGLAGGVCVLPHDPDGSLAQAIAGEPGWMVYARVPAQGLDAARAAAAKSGLLTTRLWLDREDGAALPTAERLADLLIATDLQATDLTEAKRGAWMSRLAPRRGVLAATGSDTAAIARWLPGSRSVSAGGRTWILAIRPADAGMDEWTHRLHDPANTQVSLDTTVKPKYLTQWLGLPLHEGFWGSIVVSAQGRMAVIGASRSFNQPLTLSVRSLHNGQILWERGFGWDKARDNYRGGFYAGRSCLVAHGDELLLAIDDRVERIDAETGAIRATIPGPLPGGQIKWLAAADDGLYLLAGAADTYKVSSLQTAPTNPFGNVLAAYGSTDGKPRWRIDTEGPVDERRIALADGRIVYHADDVGAAARKVADGTVVWTRALPQLEVRNPKFSDLLLSERLLLLTPESALFGGIHRPALVALAPVDGALLWNRDLPVKGRALNGVAVAGTWYNDAAYDLRSGKKTADTRIPGSGCGPSCAVNTRFVTAFGGIQRIGEKGFERNYDAKGPCDLGTLIADGTLTSIAGQCHCALESMGSRAIATGIEDATKDQPADERRVAVSTAAIAALPVDGKDWPMWRHDAAHSGASAVHAPASARLAWTCAPTAPLPAWGGRPSAAPEYPPAPPICAAGRVWYLDGTGHLRCLDAADGRERWSRQLGCQPAAAPSLADGRLFISLADGWLLALGAEDGAERWRFHVAPRQRLIAAWGRLQSTWPVLGGATVQDGTLYTAAGFQDDNGICITALDPATGALRWERRDFGAGGLNLLGQLMLTQGRLWIPTGGPLPFSISPADGSGPVPDPSVTTRNLRRGVLMGDLGDGVVLCGGRRVEPKHADLTSSERTDGLNIYPLPARPLPSVCGATIEQVSTLPCWDATLFAAGSCATRESGLLLRPMTALRDGLQRAIAKPNPESFVKAQVLPLEDAPPPRLALAPVALALAADAVVAAHVRRKNTETTWFLSAIPRDGGKERWELALPGQPRCDGIAIDRDGRILVPLLDGRLLAYAGP